MSPAEPGYRCACPTGVRLHNDRKTCADGKIEPGMKKIEIDIHVLHNLFITLVGVKSGNHVS